MYKLFFIAKNNMKKQKGDMITFIILTVLAAFLIFDCLSAIIGLDKVMDERFREINGAEIMMINGRTDIEAECAEKAISQNKHIVDYETTPVIDTYFDYKNANDLGDYSQYEAYIQSFEEEPRYMNLGIDQSKLNEDDILIPYYLKRDFPIGDKFRIKLEDEVMDFNVAGYAEDPYFCNSVNVTSYYLYISQKKVDEITEKHSAVIKPSVLCKGVASKEEMENGLQTIELEAEISSEYKKLITSYSENDVDGGHIDPDPTIVNWHIMKDGSKFIPNIIMGIIMLFALLVLLISIVIISFSIRNFIRRNMKNTGILEASGYTVKELRDALTLQIVLIAAVGAMIGVISGIATFEGFGEVVGSVSGLSWNQPINILAAVVTFLGILLVVWGVIRLISRIYNQITVLDALRGGINTHNFKRNTFSFEKTHLPVPVVLSLKDAFGNLGRNMVMMFITIMLTLAMLVGFGLYENFGKNASGLMEFMAFELGDVSVHGDKSLGDKLRTLDNVENVLGHHGTDLTIRYGSKEKNVYTYAYDDVKNSMRTRIVEGRIPEKDNEVMLTGPVAEDIGAKIGDVVEMQYGDKKFDYLVVGINQRMERMGQSIIMNMDAAEKLFPETRISYNLTISDGVSYESMKSQLEDFAEKEGLSVEEMEIRDDAKVVDSTISTITAALKALCIIISILTMLIVIFVEALVVRAKIIRDWKGMGISKALGQTSGGLILQIMISNIPAIAIGLLVGVIISQPVGAELCLLVFSFFGMKSINFNLPPIWVSGTAMAILAVAIITSGLLGLKVHGLKPVEMITEE